MTIASESSNLYTTKRFIEEAHRLKLTANYINPFEQTIFIGFNSKLKKANDSLFLFRTTGIRYDDFDLIVAKNHELKGDIIINPISDLKMFRNKDTQLQFLAKHILPIIPTINFRGPITEDLMSDLTELAPQEEFIVKMNRGNGGIGVQMLRGIDSLKSVLETFQAIKDQKMIVQPFLPHKKEYRLLLTQNKILATIEKKILKDDFRGNSKRSNGKYLKNPIRDLSNLAMKAMNLTNLNYAGIDILETNGELKILEINAVPGFQQVEELSSINIARELLNSFIKDNQKY